ncbi:MAG: hypothetical protein ACK58N_04010 [Synechocystis sp.]
MLTLGGLLIKLVGTNLDLNWSMSDVMIRGANLGKRYMIQSPGRGAGYGVLRDVLSDGGKVFGATVYGAIAV